MEGPSLFTPLSLFIVALWLGFTVASVWIQRRRKNVLERYEQRRIELGGGPFEPGLRSRIEGTADAMSVLARAPQVFRSAPWEAVFGPALVVLWMFTFLASGGMPVGVVALVLLGVAAIIAVMVGVSLLSRYRDSARLVHRAEWIADPAGREDLIDQALALDPDVIGQRGERAADEAGSSMSAAEPVTIEGDAAWGGPSTPEADRVWAAATAGPPPEAESDPFWTDSVDDVAAATPEEPLAPEPPVILAPGAPIPGMATPPLTDWRPPDMDKPLNPR